MTADAINSHNTFASPDAVPPQPFDRVRGPGDKLTFTLPAKAIVMIAIATKPE